MTSNGVIVLVEGGKVCFGFGHCQDSVAPKLFVAFYVATISSMCQKNKQTQNKTTNHKTVLPIESKSLKQEKFLLLSHMLPLSAHLSHL